MKRISNMTGLSKEKKMEYFIRRLTSGFVVEEGGGIEGGLARTRHAFTTLKEALDFLKSEYTKPAEKGNGDN